VIFDLQNVRRFSASPHRVTRCRTEFIFVPAAGASWFLWVSGRGKSADVSFKPDIDPKRREKSMSRVALRGEARFLAAAWAASLQYLMDTARSAVVRFQGEEGSSQTRPVGPWRSAGRGLAIDAKSGRLFIRMRRGPRKLIRDEHETARCYRTCDRPTSVDAFKTRNGQAFASTAGAQLFIGRRNNNPVARENLRSSRPLKTG